MTAAHPPQPPPSSSAPHARCKHRFFSEPVAGALHSPCHGYFMAIPVQDNFAGGLDGGQIIFAQEVHGWRIQRCSGPYSRGGFLRPFTRHRAQR